MLLLIAQFISGQKGQPELIIIKKKIKTILFWSKNSKKSMIFLPVFYLGLIEWQVDPSFWLRQVKSIFLLFFIKLILV
jgi:hypothetical protein